MSDFWVNGIVSRRDQQPYLQLSNEKGMIAQLTMSQARQGGKGGSPSYSSSCVTVTRVTLCNGVTLLEDPAVAYVKLDKDILTSSLWMDSDVTLLFITALLLAEPHQLHAPAAQLETRELKPTGWEVPPGWYGFVPASGIGLISHAKLPEDRGVKALETLASCDPQSRSQEYDGRRLVRINGGFIMLNYIRFREKDHSAADRMRRYRERKKEAEGGAGKEKPARKPRQTKMQQRAQVGLFRPEKK